MDRRNFIKTSLCLGCAAAVGYGCFSAGKNYNLKSKPENRFLYKSSYELPTAVRLEACNACQLNCVCCWRQDMHPEAFEKVGGFGYLKFEDFKKFVDNHSFIKSIELSNNGEIFLNPELDDIMKYAYEKGITLTAYNGVNLNTVSEKTLENLVKYKFDYMVVSIDGATPEIYEIYRRGGDLNKVIANIETINKFKKQYNSDKPHLVWQFILFGHNEHEIDAVKELAEKLNMEVHFEKNSVPEYSPIKDVRMVEEKTGLKYPEYSYNEQYSEENEESETMNEEMAAEKGNAYEDFANMEKIVLGVGKIEDIRCYQLENWPQINFNGDLLGCCTIYEENFGVNVFKEGLLKALNSSQILRAKLMLSDFSVEPFADLPCSHCFFYEEFLKPAKYELNFSSISKIS